MIYIAHRGNLAGPNPDKENSPAYIDQAIEEGFDVEVDVWGGQGMDLWLGHDAGKYTVSFTFLSERMRHLWIHCKNTQAMSLLNTYAPELRYFWHQTDDYTLTSWQDIWCYPGKYPAGKHSVIVMPESVMPLDMVLSFFDENQVLGVCSDYVKTLRYK